MCDESESFLFSRVTNNEHTLMMADLVLTLRARAAGVPNQSIHARIDLFIERRYWKSLCERHFCFNFARELSQTWR